MANTNRYWIANYTATPNFNVAANWADNADGSGANTAPTAGDMVHFGHATTLGAGFGFGSCIINAASPSLAQFTTYEGYNKVSFTGKFVITQLTRTFTTSPTKNLAELGFKSGMVVSVTGCSDAANNDTYVIQTVGSILVMANIAGGTSMANESAGNDVTITYDPSIDFNGQTITMNDTVGGVGTVMILDSKVKNSSGTGNITFAGVQVSGGGNLYYKCGENLIFENRDSVRISFTPTGLMNFDNGIYPVTILNAGDYTCNYITPTSTVHNAVNFYQFIEATSAVTWLSFGTKRQNLKKIFNVENTTGFALLTKNFNTGQSTWSFNTDASFVIPTSGDYVNYPTGFTVRWYNLIIKNSGANPARKATIPARRNLQVNSLTVEAGANVEGEKVESLSGTKYKGSSTITSNTRPTIKGSWNFSQVADGVYASLLTESYSITPSHGDRGALQFSYGGGAFHSQSKINLMMDSFTTDWDAVAWLQACDGAYFKSSFYAFCQTYAAGVGAGNDTIWISNDSPSVPYFTDSAGTKHSLIGGGGGGGMTSFDVAGTSGSAQTITNGNTLTIAAGTGITTTASATDTVTIASTITQYTDPMAIAAVEGEATLDLTGQVKIENANSFTELRINNIGSSSVVSRTNLVMESSDDYRGGGMYISTNENSQSQLWAIGKSYTKDNLQIGFYQDNYDDVVGTSNDPLQYSKNLLTMTTAGDVGINIGTDNPEARLDVRGANDNSVSGMFSGSLSVENSAELNPPSSRAYAFLSVNNGDSMVGGNLRLDDGVSGGTHAGYASGTNIRGGSGIKFSNSSSSDDGQIMFLRQNDSDDDTWTVKESGRFDENGHLGLGTTNPQVKLHVAGTIRQSNVTNAIVHADANGDLGALTVGTNLSLNGSTLNANGDNNDGLIDLTGIVFTPQATNPETTNPLDTIWLNSETGHLMRGDRDTESTVHFNVRNDEGITIPLGAPLYSKGEIGGSDRIKVGIADASDPAKMPAIGVAMEEMNTTSTKDSNMILTGVLNENITITGVTERDIIYVAPHGGTAPYLTVTRPTSGSHLVQNVGVCVKQASANISQGIYVSAIGRTNDIPNGVITTNSADADYVYIDDGNTFKKITPADLGIGGGGAATEVVEFVNSNTTINMNTTIAVCASNTDCTAKAGVTGASWAGMTDFGSTFENYDFTATSSVFGAAQKGLVDVPVPTVGRKLTLLVPFPCDGRSLPQGISQISCTGQNGAFIGHDLAGMVVGNEFGKATQGSNVLLPETYLFGAWSSAGRRLNTRAYLGHHAITLVGVPAPTGNDAAKTITGGASFGDVMPHALWWVETNNEFLWDTEQRNAPTGFFDDRAFGMNRAWGQLYVVC